MTRGLLLAAAFLAAMTTDAAACHRFSVWRFPFPQQCGFSPTIAKQAARRAPRLQILANSRKPAPMPQDRPALPLPSLARADLAGGQADEPTRARVLLRAALEAAIAH
jgi:hypothetical protein